MARLIPCTSRWASGEYVHILFALTHWSQLGVQTHGIVSCHYEPGSECPYTPNVPLVTSVTQTLQDGFLL